MMMPFDAGGDLAAGAGPAGMPPGAAAACAPAAKWTRGAGNPARPGQPQAGWGARLIISSRRAASAVEYALITAMVAVVIMMSLDMFDAKLRRIYTTITGAL
jgi:Flp pilus assembly pilin Flp